MVIDDVDLKLIRDLYKGGVLKNSTLSSGIGLGERTVRRRISALKSKELIRIGLVVNPVIFGYKGWAKIGIKVEPELLKFVADTLVAHPATYSVVYALGSFDIIAGVLFKTIDELTEFVTLELTRIKGITSTETMLLIRPRKFHNFSWPSIEQTKMPDKKQAAKQKASSNYQITDLDMKIIEVLSKDSELRPNLIKEKLNISEVTIRKHIKDMVRNEIYKMIVIPNPDILQTEVWATIGIKTNRRSVDAILDDIINDSSIYLASISVGRFNIILSALFVNIDSLNEFVNIYLPNIAGISSVETFLHNKPRKSHNSYWIYD